MPASAPHSISPALPDTALDGWLVCLIIDGENDGPLRPN